MRLMTRMTQWCGALAVGMLACAAWGLPEELQHLEELEGNEQAVLDAARRFDVQQKALIEWDQRLLNDYMAQGKTDLANTKQEDILRRVRLLRDLWTWVIERYPRNARANNYYGEYLYDFGGDVPQALRHWRMALQLDDNLAPVHNNLALHYFHQGNYGEGLNHLQRALDLDKDNPDYLYNMAQMYLVHFPQLEELLGVPRQKLYKEAMKMSRRAAELAPGEFDFIQDYAVNFYAAENFGLEADWEEAARAWQQAVERARTESEQYYALLNEGRAWLQAGRPQEAIAPLEQAVELRDENGVAQRVLAKARRQAGA